MGRRASIGIHVRGLDEARQTVASLKYVRQAMLKPLLRNAARNTQRIARQMAPRGGSYTAGPARHLQKALFYRRALQLGFSMEDLPFRSGIRVKAIDDYHLQITSSSRHSRFITEPSAPHWVPTLAIWNWVQAKSNPAALWAIRRAIATSGTRPPHPGFWEDVLQASKDITEGLAKQHNKSFITVVKSGGQLFAVPVVADPMSQALAFLGGT